MDKILENLGNIFGIFMFISGTSGWFVAEGWDILWCWLIPGYSIYIGLWGN